MRRLAIGLGIAVALAAAATVAVVLGLNRVIEANRDRIVAGMSKGFGRPVQVERISTTFYGGIAIQLDGFRIADDPAFAHDDFLTAERAYAVLRIWPLFERRLDVRRIAARAPRLTIIRTADGLNVDSLGRRPEATRPPRAAAPPKPAGGEATIPAFAIALVHLEHGRVRFIDRTGATPSETTIEPLEVRLSDLSLTTPMHVEIDATTTGAAPATFRLRGTVGPIGDPPFAADVPIEQHVALETAAVAVDALTITGRVRRTPAGKPVAGVRLAAPSIRAWGIDVAGLEATAVEQDGVATLERLAFRVFGGTVEGKGTVDHTGPTRFAFDTTVRGVDVSQALATRSPEIAERFTGRLDGDVSLSGTAGDDALARRSLAGTGRVVVRGGRLEAVNVAEKVLTGATGMKGFVTLVPPRVRDRYPAIFDTDDTYFDELSAEVRVGSERIHVDTMRVAAADYAISGKGVITFAKEADLTATLQASPALTADVVGALDVAHVLTDSTGRLAVPFRLVGVLPNVRPKPDADSITRVLQKAITGDALERLLGGGKRSDPKKPSDAKRAEERLKRGLGKLFGR